jgi:hypothetical protein
LAESLSSRLRRRTGFSSLRLVTSRMVVTGRWRIRHGSLTFIDGQ